MQKLLRSFLPGQALARRHAHALLLATVSLLGFTRAHAQGCVAARGSGLPNSFTQGDATNPWVLSVSYRWYQSDRHFVGTTEQKQRETNGDQVINRQNFTDFDLNYTISPRYGVDLTIPYVSNDRSQVVKDSNAVILDRYHTQASGFGDLSVIGTAWIYDPTKVPKGNIQVGFGVVLPTGKHDVKDVFEAYDKTSGKIVAVQKYVDESIQPGTGGYGLTATLYGYYQLGAGFTGFLSADYTATPQNEVTATGNSISDTYLGRVGVEYELPTVQGLAFSVGLRVEGVMVYDLIGDSEGFRRPGYSVDFEPGIVYSHKRWVAQLYVPVAFQRNRQQSVPDKEKTAATGKYTHGDAAFADYEIIASLSYKF